MLNSRFKYQRTQHLPWSKKVTNDDTKLHHSSCFHGKSVIITEKLDGENSTMYNDYYHARSLDGVDHPSRSWIKQFHASIKYNIPNGYRICGENMYAKHSIEYTNLKSYFYCFSIWDETNMCLSWDDTTELCALLGIEHVPVLHQPFIWDDALTPNLLQNDKLFQLDLNSQEGYVIRNSSSFHYDEFSNNVAKWVRANHVQTDSHWMHSQIIPNTLIQPSNPS